MKINTRQTRYGTYAVVYTLIIIGVLGAANWLAQEHNKSFDATSNKRFTLSDQTDKLVKNLKSDVSVTYYDEQARFTAARDLLDRYRNLSSKLKVDYIDPVKKPTLAKAAGVRALGTIVLSNGVKREEAKSLTEEEVTGALVRLLKEGERNICVVTGAGERAIEDTGRNGFSGAKEGLEKSNYKVRAISLVEGKSAVPADCTAILVAGPKREYFDVAVEAIKTYIDGGGRAMFLLDPPLKFGKDQTSRNEKLVAQLAAWGVEVRSDLALDTSPVGQLFGFNELVPVVTTFESHIIVKDLGNVMAAFPITSTVQVKAGAAEPLFSTSKNSYATEKLDSPEIRIDPSKDKPGPFPLAAAAKVKGAKEGRIVVVGSSDWASNSLIVARQIANRDIFLNMVNWLTSDEDLISIRPKDPEDRRLALSGRTMKILFFSNVVGIPLAIILSGIVMWMKRR